MNIVVTVIHVLACFFLIVVVLLQTGKGADIGAVFGGSSQTIFGSSGAGNLLTRLTTWTAVIFMLTSLFLTWSSTASLTTSVVDAIPSDPPPISEPALPSGGDGGSGAAAPAGGADAGSGAPAGTAGSDAAAPAAEGSGSAAPGAAAPAGGDGATAPAAGGAAGASAPGAAAPVDGAPQAAAPGSAAQAAGAPN